MSGERQGKDALPTAYRGADRRGRNAGVLAPLQAKHVMPMTALVAAGAGAPALFFLLHHPGVTVLDSYGAAAAGLLCVVGGATWLVTWRIVGRAYQGWLGCALIAFGALTLFSDVVPYAGTRTFQAAEPLDDLVTAAIAGYLVWRGLTDDEVNAALHPMVNLVVAIGAATAAMGFSNLAATRGGMLGWATSATFWEACNGAAAAIWLIVVIAGAKRVETNRPVPTWTVAVAALFGLACITRTFEWWAPATTVAIGFTFLAAALADGAAITRLQEVLANDDRRQLRLHTALDASRHQALDDQQRLEEWLHDLRNAVSGLQAADAVLRAGAPSGTAEHAQLADAVTAELARLHTLMDPSRQMHVVDVDLEEALEPIVTAERTQGTQVTTRLAGLRVRADRGALCRAVQNVLLNARHYASGTPVDITARRLGGAVELSIRDRGPGVPPHERSSLFERGTRGATSVGTSGSGLGLWVARTLARAMGGEIRLQSDVSPGCCIVLTLPLADCEPDSSPTEGDSRQAGDALLEPVV